MKITNTQAGPRGVNTVTGPVLVDPNQTVDVEVYAREKQHLDASGWFDIKGSYTPDPAGPDAASTASADTTSRQRIAELEQAVKDRDARIAELEKEVPETDVDKMTVTELRDFLKSKNVKFSDENKAELLELAKTVKA